MAKQFKPETLCVQAGYLKIQFVAFQQVHIWKAATSYVKSNKDNNSANQIGRAHV